MGNFWNSFASGFEKGYDPKSISKGIEKSIEDKKAKEEFEEFASTPMGQDLIEKVGYKPTAKSTMDDFYTTVKTLSAGATLEEKEVKAKRGGNFDSMIGAILGDSFRNIVITPPEEAYRNSDPSRLIGAMGQSRQPNVQGIALPKGMGITGGTISPTGGSLTLGEDIEEKRAWEELKSKNSAARELEKSVDKKMFDELGEKYGQAGRIAQAMRGIIGYGKTMDEANLPNWLREAAGTDIGGRLIPWLPDAIQNKLEPVLNYVSQLVETKVGALPILSGQARYVVDLANAIAHTQASAGLNTNIREGLATQSLRNISALVYAIENGYVTAETLAKAGITEDSTPEVSIKGGKIVLPKEATNLLKAIKLTPEQEKDIEGAIDYLLSTPAIKKGKFVKEEKGNKLSSGMKYTVVK